MKALLLAISCGLLALPALSQATLSCTGRIVKAPATPCDPTATHMIDCTQVLLKSSTVTLSTWENKVVDLTGNETVGACNIIDVATVANPAYKHTITGTFKLGSTITWKGAGPILSLAVIYLAGDSSFLPLSTFGALFIDRCGHR